MIGSGVEPPAPSSVADLIRSVLSSSIGSTRRPATSGVTVMVVTPRSVLPSIVVSMS